MRHSVRFTNIEMLMIENAFCKHPWISDNISRDQKQLDNSDRIGRIGNLKGRSIFIPIPHYGGVPSADS